MRALVTGASGFVGRVLCRQLRDAGVVVRAAARTPDGVPFADEVSPIGDIGARPDWTEALDGIDTVFHLAAIAHIVDKAAQRHSPYERVNAEGTVRLAQAAAHAGVRRFVFLSSLKVNGDVSPEGGFTERSPLQPEGAYAVSKARAEHGLLECAARTNMRAVIIRSPLVYGPGVRANFLALICAIDRGWPLPFGAINNRRSLIYSENLASALHAVSGDAAGHAAYYLVSDGPPIATPDLVRRIAGALGRAPRLVPVPAGLLRVIGTLTRTRGALDRLIASLSVDDRAIRAEAGWRPPHTMDDGLAATVAWYRQKTCR